jgi:hypothetical protein
MISPGALTTPHGVVRSGWSTMRSNQLTFRIRLIGHRDHATKACEYVVWCRNNSMVFRLGGVPALTEAGVRRGAITNAEHRWIMRHCRLLREKSARNVGSEPSIMNRSAVGSISPQRIGCDQMEAASRPDNVQHDGVAADTKAPVCVEVNRRRCRPAIEEANTFRATTANKSLATAWFSPSEEPGCAWRTRWGSRRGHR